MESAVILFLFFALALGSFAPAWYTGALHRRVHVRLPYAMILSGPLIHTLFFAAGLFAVRALTVYLPSYSCIAGQFIILIVGLKLIIESIRFLPEEKIVLADDLNMLLMAGLARGINYLLIGIGLGLCSGINPGFLIILLIAEVVAISSGLFSGYRFGLKSFIRTLFLLSGLAILSTAIRSLLLQI